MALTVRREGVSSGGTLSRPVPIAIDLTRVDPATIQKRQLLGYEALPSTAVYGISSPRRFELRLGRDSSDRYARHIQVSVIDAAGQTAYQITTASGQGEWQLLPAGDYRIVAALLIPEEVELGLTIVARPARTRLGPVVAEGAGTGAARLGRGIPAIAEGHSPSVAIPTKPHLQAVGGGTGVSTGHLLEVRGSEVRCQCIGEGSGSASGVIAPMVWVDAYGRPLGEGIYVAPVALDQPELVQGSDWAVSVQLLAQATGLPRDLTDLTFSAEIWDQQRSFRYALCTITVASLNGGPITASLTPGQTAVVGDYEGQVLLFDLKAQHSSGALAYLLEGLVTVRLGASQPL